MPTSVPATTLPDWLQYVQALGPTLVAFAVAYVAFRQWRTAEANRKIANDKLVLDLFDKRFSWYEALKRNLFRSLDATNDEVRSAYLEITRLSEESRFLFGDDVVRRMEQLGEASMSLSVVVTVLEDPEQKAEERAAKVKAYTAVAGPLSQDLPNLLAPYMKMDQRR
jgi:hypothetical protein